MASITKSHPRFDFQAARAQNITVNGGLVALDALAREFDLWNKIKATPLLDPRRDKKRGFSPEVPAAQIILSLCSGGAGLADAERLGKDETICRLLGLERTADAATLGEWLRAQSPQSLNALQGLNRDLVAWTLAKADPKRVRRNGRLEVFFDDTQIELFGRYFEGARTNYNGDTTLSWQTLWVGPFIADGILDEGSIDVSAHLPALLRDTERLWEDAALMGQAHFYADSGSSAGKHLNAISPHRWSWSVSYNKWTDAVGRLAKELPESGWSAPHNAIGRKGQAIIEQHSWVRHIPGEECTQVQDFAVVRYRDADGLPTLWSYAFVAGKMANRQSLAHQPEAARELFALHKLKGAREQGFSEVLSDMDLHHPPCQSLTANRMFYALGMLAYNLMQAFQVLHMDDEHQNMRVRSLMRHLVTVPLKVVQHARRISARVLVPVNWVRWWTLFIRKVLPRRPRGRPASGESGG
jgi:hypothetical protein